MVVPTIQATDVNGYAETLLDVQNNSNPSYPAVQIGVAEDVTRGVATYKGVWTDSALNYSFQTLQLLHPGDQVALNLTRSNNSWLITLENHTTAANSQYRLPYGTDSQFTQASWQQYDLSRSTRGEKYPQMTTITMTNVMLNNSPINLDLSYASTLFTNDGQLYDPTAMVAQSFSFTTPTALAALYIRDAKTVNAASQPLSNAIAHWDSVSLTQRASLVDAETSALRTFDHELAAQSWPVPVEAFVTSLIAKDVQLVSEYQAWRHSGYSLTDPINTAIDANAADGTYPQAIRQALGIPIK
jgi:hypothetical protein